MLSSCMNLDQLHHFVYRTGPLGLELAFFQKKIFTLESDNETLADSGVRMITFV